MTTSLPAADAATGGVSPETDGFPTHRRRRRRTRGHPDASLAARTAPDQAHDASDGGDPGPDGRLLSVSEIQQALRELRVGRPGAAPDGPTPPSRPLRDRAGEWAGSADAPMQTHPCCAEEDGGDVTAGARAGRNRQQPAGPGDGAQRRRGSRRGPTPAGAPDGAEGGFPADWVAVVAAHAGAGASTVALALSDAAAAADRRVHLVETAAPARCGLVAAACAELGTDATGRWRRGARPGVVIDRRAGAVSGGWPSAPVGEGPAVTVVDLGLPAAADLGRLATAGVRTDVVCRATVPGVRATEQVLGWLTGLPIVAVVGPRRWPGEVTASLGLRLRELQASGRVLRVPTDRRLEITGPGPAPQPRSVRAAGAALWQLLDTAGPAAAADPASVVSTRRGVHR